MVMVRYSQRCPECGENHVEVRKITTRGASYELHYTCVRCHAHITIDVVVPGGVSREHDPIPASYGVPKE